MANIVQEQQTLKFTGKLLIANIGETLASLDQVTLKAPLVLDFSNVTDVDTVAISVVLEIQRRLHHQSPKAPQLTIAGVPDNLRSLMQLYGVDTFLLQ